MEFQKKENRKKKKIYQGRKEGLTVPIVLYQ